MNKLRTFLSLLGVMVGIFVISAVFAVVDSMEDNLIDQFSMLDEDVLFVQKWAMGILRRSIHGGNTFSEESPL